MFIISFAQVPLVSLGSLASRAPLDRVALLVRLVRKASLVVRELLDCLASPGKQGQLDCLARQEILDYADQPVSYMMRCDLSTVTIK